MNSRAKGARGERQVRDLFREAGLEARRGQQFSGGGDSPDVVVPVLADRYHLEVKFVQGIHSKKLYDAILQAKRDAPDKTFLVMSKENNGQWLCTLPATELIRLLVEALPPFAYPPISTRP
jgi:hypothetical protein